MIIVQFIVNALILGLLLALIAEVNIQNDIQRPLAIIFLASIASMIPVFLLDGLIADIISLGLYLWAFYAALGHFYYEIGSAKRKKIIMYFMGINILFSVLTSVLFRI